LGGCFAGARALAGAVAKGPTRGGPTARTAEAVKKKTASVTTDLPEELDWAQVSPEWEVDCFSRPVMRDGKKMWELLLADENAVYRRVAQMKPTRVNSVVVGKVLKIFFEESKVKPTHIRFFRKVMKNMLTVALNNIRDSMPQYGELRVLPSRNCHMLRQWLGYREREVYPTMEGFSAITARKGIQQSMIQMSYDVLPTRMNFNKYMMGAMKVSALRALSGKLLGKMCPLPAGLDGEEKVIGVLILSPKSKSLVNQWKSEEVCGIRYDSENAKMLLDLGIDTTHMFETVPPEYREECLKFEKGKKDMGGIHWVGVQDTITAGAPDPDDPTGGLEGLWLCMDHTDEDAV